MPTAEILTIGTEILLGEILDTNTAYLARVLKDLGVDLYRTQTVGDNPGRISAIIKDILSRADLLITTGGLGPTIDDPTRQAVADAFNLSLEFNEECWKDIQAYFLSINRDIPENNKRQAYLPHGSTPIHNPVGTAPGFILSNQEKMLISLPGVPKEMELLVHQTVIPAIQKRWQLHSVILTRVLHVAGIGEANLDNLVADYEKLANPTVGLLAKNGIVDIRIAAKSGNQVDARHMIDKVSSELISILGDHYFGMDNTTLSDSIASLAASFHDKYTVQVYGYKGEFRKALSSYLSGWNIQETDTIPADFQNPFTFYFMGYFDQHPAKIVVNINATENIDSIERKYAGPPENSLTWGINTSLDIIRRFMLKQIKLNGR